MNTIDFDKHQGLVPAIIQDANTLKVLMLGYMNKEAYEKTQATEWVTFYSRSRKCLWTKGETSGNRLKWISIDCDCDGDTLLIKAVPQGPTCHTGTDTCWGEKNSKEEMQFLNYLQEVIDLRKKEMPKDSYTTYLFKEGVNRMAQKVGEEAVETVIGATTGNDENLIYEGADLLYHLMVLLSSKGYGISDLAEELKTRHK